MLAAFQMLFYLYVFYLCIFLLYSALMWISGVCAKYKLIFFLILLLFYNRYVCVLQLIEILTTNLPVSFITDLLGPQSLLHRLRFGHSKEVSLVTMETVTITPQHNLDSV